MLLNTDTDQLREIQHQVIVKELYNRVDECTEALSDTKKLFEGLKILRFIGSATPYKLYQLSNQPDTLSYGDVYNCRDYSEGDPRPDATESAAMKKFPIGMNVVWTEDGWDEFSSSVNLAPYVLTTTLDDYKTQMEGTVEKIYADMDGIARPIVPDAYPVNSTSRITASSYIYQLAPVTYGTTTITIGNGKYALVKIRGGDADGYSSDKYSTARISYTLARDPEDDTLGTIELWGFTIPQVYSEASAAAVLDLNNLSVTILKSNGNKATAKAELLANSFSIVCNSVGLYTRTLNTRDMTLGNSIKDYNFDLRPVAITIKGSNNVHSYVEYSTYWASSYSPSFSVGYVVLYGHDSDGDDGRAACGTYHIRCNVKLVY